MNERNVQALCLAIWDVVNASLAIRLKFETGQWKSALDDIAEKLPESGVLVPSALTDEQRVEHEIDVAALERLARGEP